MLGTSLISTLYIQTWPEPLFYPLYESDFATSALDLRPKKKETASCTYICMHTKQMLVSKASAKDTHMETSSLGVFSALYVHVPTMYVNGKFM